MSEQVAYPRRGWRLAAPADLAAAAVALNGFAPMVFVDPPILLGSSLDVLGFQRLDAARDQRSPSDATASHRLIPSSPPRASFPRAAPAGDAPVLNPPSLDQPATPE